MLNPSIIASPSECEIIDTETISFMCAAYILWKTSCTLPQCLKILDIDFQISKHINFMQIKTKHIPKFSLSHLWANQQKIKIMWKGFEKLAYTFSGERIAQIWLL